MDNSYGTLIGGSFHTSKSLSEGQEFDLLQRLRENVCDLPICSNVLEPYCSLLYHILDKVVPDINVLGAVVEHGIL